MKFLLIFVIYCRYKIRKQNSYYLKSLVSWSDVRSIIRSESNYIGSLKSQNTRNMNTVSGIAVVGQEIVFVKILGKHNVFPSAQCVRKEVLMMQCQSHENINRFIGLCLEGNLTAVLMSYSHRGSLYERLHSEETTLTTDIKQSLLMDIARGMRYLHSTDIGLHTELLFT